MMLSFFLFGIPEAGNMASTYYYYYYYYYYYHHRYYFIYFVLKLVSSVE